MGAGTIVGEAALAGAGPPGDDFLAQVVGEELTPEFAAIVADEYRRLFGSLTDESLRVVALLKLEGYSNEEIAKSLDCALRTVERKLDVIRKRWRAERAVNGNHERVAAVASARRRLFSRPDRRRRQRDAAEELALPLGVQEF